jgi:purine-binding chemotaxis protein CheW
VAAASAQQPGQRPWDDALAKLVSDGLAERDRSASMLLCRVATRLCALPLDSVVEIMRPLPTQPLAGAPSYVPGVAIVRGDAIPVVDLASLLGPDGAHPTRFVTVRVDGRFVALAVDEVVGVQSVAESGIEELPPLLDGAPANVVSAIGTLDAELLLVLRSVRLVPSSVWALLDDGATAT